MRKEEYAKQLKWIEEHQGASYLVADKGGRPAVAIYINPVWQYYAETPAAIAKTVLAWAEDILSYIESGAEPTTEPKGD